MNRKLIAWFVFLGLAVLVATGLILREMNRPRIVAERTLPDGTRTLVTQVLTMEGYQVGFYFLEPNARWGWCYLDHEGSSWRNGSRIDYDPAAEVVDIWQGSVLRGRWDRKKKEYSRPDIGGWTASAPQAFYSPRL
ncbi:MAG: hypothetical protein JWO82_2102 [Akkermansiaceae bacterium]|nr:hypothetical protein [Akkermansiaceae bacterium]